MEERPPRGAAADVGDSVVVSRVVERAPRGAAADVGDSVVVSRVVERVVDGRQHLNEYALLATLGRGSFGEVVLARDTTTGELVALKAFSKSRLLKQRDVRRVGRQTVVTTGLDKVLSEVAVLRRLASASANSGDGGGSDGAHIVGLRRVLADPDSDDMYLVLDYADAGPLMTPCDPASSDPDEAACVVRTLRILSQGAAAEGAATEPAPPACAACGADGSRCGVANGEGDDVGLSMDEGGGSSGGSDSPPSTSAPSAPSCACECHAAKRRSAGAAPTATSVAAATASPALHGVYRCRLPGSPGPLPLGDARQVAFDVLSALACAHAAGAAHRDVKPDNVLVTSSGRALLGDWGSGRLVGGQLPPPSLEDGYGGGGATATAAPAGAAADWVSDTVGTFAFLAPEACGGGEDDDAGDGADDDGGLPPLPPMPGSAAAAAVAGYRAFPADVWAAGVCLYVAVFGVLPFGRDADNPLDVFTAIRRQPLLPLPVRLAARPDEVSDGEDAERLLDLLVRLLDRRPAGRPTAAAALEHAFFEPLRAVPPPPRPGFPPLDVASLPPYVTPEMSVGAAAGSGGAAAVPPPAAPASSATDRDAQPAAAAATGLRGLAARLLGWKHGKRR